MYFPSLIQHTFPSFDMQKTFDNVFDQVSRKIKAFKQTPLEKEVTDATSNDNWGVANSALIQLARATSDYNSFSTIMRGIWEGLSDKKERWRRIYKSLVLLEYCIKYGAERACNEARAESYKIRPLQDFKFMEEGRDKGPGIREKSKYIVDLLADTELLTQERAKAQESKEKYSGIASSGGGQTVVVPSGYAGNNYSSSSAPVAGRAMPSMSSDSYAENSTNKLEEYREKERQRKSAASSQKSSVINEPVLSSSGKVVVKSLPVNGKAPNQQGSRRVSSSSSSSSSSSDSSDSSPENKKKSNIKTTNLIDFDASPVSKPAPAPVPKPVPAVAPQVAQPLAYGLAPTAPQPAFGFPQQQPTYPQYGYQQQTAYPNLGYGQTNYPQQGYPQQSPMYGSPNPSAPSYPGFTQGASPAVYPNVMPAQPAYNPYTAAAPSAPPVQKDTNPFAAFDGL